MRESFWAREWFLGLVVSLLVMVAATLGQLHPLDTAIYDLGMQLSSATASPRITIIAIGTKSLDSLGPWPWPRSRLAELIDRLQAGGPSAIGTTVPLTKPQIDPGLSAVRELQSQYASSSLARASVTLDSIRHNILLGAHAIGGQPPRSLASVIHLLRTDAPLQRLSSDLRRLHATLYALGRHLDTDRALAEAIKQAGNVELGMPFEPGITQGKPQIALTSTVRANALSALAHDVRGPDAVSAYSIHPPLAAFAANAAGVGIFRPSADRDGRIRRTPLAVRYYGHYLPTLGLLLALHGLGLPPRDLTYRQGVGLVAGSVIIRTNTALQLRPQFYHSDGTKPAFATYSFADVLNGNVPISTFHDKIVLFGRTARSITPQLTTATGVRVAPVQLLADTISSILDQNAVYTPGWALWVRLAVWTAILLYVIGILPWLSDSTAVVASLILLTSLIVATLYPLVNRDIWVGLANPAFLLLCAQLLLLLKRRLLSRNGLLPPSADALENIRMLGLAFQGQGQFDMAFDRFRQLPPREPALELLYNLALDYERRRRLSRAHEVYAYIHRHKRRFRDVKARMKRTATADRPELVPVGDSGLLAGGGTLVLATDGLQKPTLGRYEVEREIGRGAMSVVYEGRDPKIGRVVAIKTVPLSSEFEGGDLDQAKRRFYREAETAGRLSHPNIVTIYDVGEEHDLAYIAMEYLAGRNLTHFLNRKQLLPTSTVLEIIAKCALALDYAHQHNIVHRDVKPANIVFDIDANSIKLTDFGIARITDTNRTKTGTVMGTPSYMSPEQLAGQPFDGRSDLFSLGITCFQLLTGTLPFKADTMASLMYKITNEAHPAVNSLRDDLAPCVSPIINKVLQKNPDRRFQRGREMAERLLRCAYEIRKTNT